MLRQRSKTANNSSSQMIIKKSKKMLIKIIAKNNLWASKNLPRHLRRPMTIRLRTKTPTQIAHRIKQRRRMRPITWHHQTWLRRRQQMSNIRPSSKINHSKRKGRVSNWLRWQSSESNRKYQRRKTANFTAWWPDKTMIKRRWTHFSRMIGIILFWRTRENLCLRCTATFTRSLLYMQLCMPWYLSRQHTTLSIVLTCMICSIRRRWAWQSWMITRVKVRTRSVDYQRSSNRMILTSFSTRTKKEYLGKRTKPRPYTYELRTKRTNRNNSTIGKWRNSCLSCKIEAVRALAQISFRQPTIKRRIKDWILFNNKFMKLPKLGARYQAKTHTSSFIKIKTKRNKKINRMQMKMLRKIPSKLMKIRMEPQKKIKK